MRKRFKSVSYIDSIKYQQRFYGYFPWGSKLVPYTTNFLVPSDHKKLKITIEEVYVKRTK